MPTAPPKDCLRCHKATTDGNVCKECKAKTKTERDNSVKHLYDSRVWRSRFSPMMLRLNPICQRLDDDGKQCDRPATVVHHLRSPRECPTRFLDPTNVVCVCERHHPPDAGTPNWKPFDGVSGDYVKTRTPKPSF